MLKLSSITPVAFELAQLSDALWVSWAHSLLIERVDDDKGHACFCLSHVHCVCKGFPSNNGWVVSQAACTILTHHHLFLEGDKQFVGHGLGTSETSGA